MIDRSKLSLKVIQKIIWTEILFPKKKKEETTYTRIKIFNIYKKAHTSSSSN